ncbi:MULTISPECIES: restriction endonuclease [Salinibacter]|uniref:restriction endonuclease n=1 Tax=Salinibacter TaxID=146918 RepID=UPI001ABB3AF5|nr:MULTISPECIES: restriction endonuclease [Salinibacter]
MPQSRYENIHDRFSHSDTTKKGTKYERLAALVLKALDESRAVVHDVRLIGESAVSHQIDVDLEVDGATKRVIVECKDFDVSGSKVGLDIVRSFWAVVDDALADEAMILTCNGFTQDARKFAKHKGIKLVVLRQYEEKDDDQYIGSIRVNVTYITRGQPEVKLDLSSDEAKRKFFNDLEAAELSSSLLKGDPVYIHSDGSKTQLHEFIDEKIGEYDDKDAGMVRHHIDVTNCLIEVEDRGGIPMAALTAVYEVHHIIEDIDVASGLIAELVVQGTEDRDIFLFDRDLEKFNIDPDTGEVI